MLLGYALMGKGFAYLGFPPLYVGEIAFLTGIVVFLRTGALVASLATLPSLVLVALMVWVLARTLPFVGLYGFDSLRDSTIVMYGGFAFIVIGLLLEDARRIDTVLRYYRIIAGELSCDIRGVLAHQVLGGIHPEVIRSRADRGYHGECGRNASGGNHGFRPDRLPQGLVLWVFVWLATLAMVGATNRGATLAALVPIMFAMLMLGRLRLLLTTSWRR